jgi:hypothetical protein
MYCLFWKVGFYYQSLESVLIWGGPYVSSPQSLQHFFQPKVSSFCEQFCVSRLCDEIIFSLECGVYYGTYYSKIIFHLGVLELGLYEIGFTQHVLGFIN